MQLIVASPLGYLVPNEVLCIEKVESVCRHCNCVVPMRKMPIFFVLSILQHESLLDAISSLNLSLSASIIFFFCSSYSPLLLLQSSFAYLRASSISAFKLASSSFVFSAAFSKSVLIACPAAVCGRSLPACTSS